MRSISSLYTQKKVIAKREDYSQIVDAFSSQIGHQSNTLVCEIISVAARSWQVADM